MEPIREVETDSSTVKSAANRIFEQMKDDTPSDDAIHPEDELKAQKDQAEEPVAEAEPDVEEAAEPTESTEEEPITRFTELADHLGVEEEFLENLIVPTKINGEVKNATIKDLIATYQKGESADLKLMGLAEERKKFETEANSAKEQLQQEWGRIQALNMELENLFTGADPRELEDLKYSDPEEYDRRVADRNNRQQRAERLRQKMSQEQGQRVTEQYSKMIQLERNKLLQNLPEWGDEKVAEKENAEMRSYLISQGFKDWEIDGKIENGMITHPGVIDHRAVILARKAWLYDQSKKSTEPKKAKLKSLPKVGAGKPKAKSEIKQEEAQVARGVLRKTGSVEDAARAIRKMMEK